MNIEKILKRHKLWLNGKRGGERADLMDANLKGADLKGANLRNANIEGADLEGADLEGANLMRTEGRHADLKGADLRNANLRFANLWKANLRDADLEGANLMHADLKGADLRGTILDFSCWPLWCGSLNVKVDERLVSQLMYHICSLDVSGCEEEIQKQIKSNISLANKFLKYRRGLNEIE